MEAFAVSSLVALALSAARARARSRPFVPLVDLANDDPSPEEVRCVIEALRGSGFLIVKAPKIVKPSLQRAALDAATTLLDAPPRSPEALPQLTQHPIDPKRYAMLTRDDVACAAERQPSIAPPLLTYFDSMEKLKVRVLRCMALGLGLRPNFFADLHDECNSTLRIIRYQAGTAATGNRCKEHSDYGSVTLLATDGVAGLEALCDATRTWRAIFRTSRTASS